MWITQASQESKAQPETVWKLWADVANWNRWDEGIESSRLEGGFITGGKGSLTPTGAPELPFVLTEVVPNQLFSDHTQLPGATLKFTHWLEATPSGCRITHQVSISGEVWQQYAETFGKQLERDLPHTVASLARLAESLVEA